jgi:disulfide bond formation protein DsbB
MYGIMSLFSFLGMMISGRLIWLYVYPHNTVNCFLPIEKIIGSIMPIKALFELTINGAGTCQEPQSIIPITLSVCALLIFMVLSKLIYGFISNKNKSI